MPTTDPAISQRLRELMEAHLWSQQAAAHALGTTQPTIYRTLEGISRPRRALRERIESGWQALGGAGPLHQIIQAIRASPELSALVERIVLEMNNSER